MHRVRHLLHPALPITSGARATALAVLAASLLGAAGVAFQDKAPEPTPRSDQTTRIKLADGKRQLDVRMKGDVRLNGEAPEPVAVPGDGSFHVEERKGGKTRAYTALRDKATYQVDGQAKALDKEGQDWLRAIVTETVKAQAGREQAQTQKLRAEQERARAEGQQGRLVEDHSRHRRDLEAQTKDLDLQLKELSPEERARVRADLDQARAELDRARAEGRNVRVKVIKKQGDGPGSVILRKERTGQDEIGKQIEIQTEDVGPGVVVIRKKVDGKDVLEKRVKILRKGGDAAEEETVVILGPEDEEAVHQELRIPRVHARSFAHPGDDDRQLEMAEIRAELRALQARLDQLQKPDRLNKLDPPTKDGTAAPRAPKPPRTHLPPLAPLAPRSMPPIPPPPPPPPAPDAPPPPPAAPPVPPVPPAPEK